MKSRCVEFALAAKTACLHAKSPSGLSLRHRLALSIAALRHEAIDQSARVAVADFLACCDLEPVAAAQGFERFMMGWETAHITAADRPAPQKQPVQKLPSEVQELPRKPKVPAQKDKVSASNREPDMSWRDRADLK